MRRRRYIVTGAIPSAGRGISWCFGVAELWTVWGVRCVIGIASHGVSNSPVLPQDSQKTRTSRKPREQEYVLYPVLPSSNSPRISVPADIVLSRPSDSVPGLCLYNPQSSLYPDQFHRASGWLSICVSGKFRPHLHNFPHDELIVPPVRYPHGIRLSYRNIVAISPALPPSGLPCSSTTTTM